jgi:hypothetical protein
MSELTDEELKAELQARSGAQGKEPVPLWRGLKERPAPDAPGWEVVGNPPLTHKVWRNPATGEVEWSDYPNQAKGRPGVDYLFIASGVQDVYPEANDPLFKHGGPWNSLWTPAAGYNESETEIGLERIRQYSGARPHGISGWPQRFKDAWNETHPSDYGLK